MKSIIESLLFVSRVPLKVDTIAPILEGKTQEDIKKALIELKNEYEARHSAIQVIEISGGWQLATKKEYSSYIKQFYKKERTLRLSNSALETLAIVGYKQPITRNEIESIRGVDSGGVIRTLMERHLIRICGRKQTIGYPRLYKTTSQFLFYFGLKSIDDLPLLEDSISEEVK